MPSPAAIEVEHISKRFRVFREKPTSIKQRLLTAHSRAEDFWALRDVSLDVREGSTFGLIGHNGSGKTTLLKTIAGILRPTSGAVRQRGRLAALLELGAGFHPELTGRENVYLNASFLGLSRKETDAAYEGIVEFAELPDFMDNQVKFYSSGMLVRLGFAVAVHVEPDVLLVDEVLAVGDEAFQQKCQGRIWDFKRAGGTIVFVSHDPNAVERVCDRAIMLEDGRVAEEGAATDIVHAYHRRLVTGEDEVEQLSANGGSSGGCRVHEVRALASDGSVRDRFTEGEPAALEVWLYAEQPLDGVRVTVGIRDGNGRPVGSQTLTDVRLRAQRLERVRLRFPGLPMREGRYFVDIGVGGRDGRAELALAERALELTVFGQDSGASGPIRLGGTWELPPVDGAGEG